MIAALSSEWLKLRTTRTIFWLLVALAGLITLIVVAATLSASKADLSDPANNIGIVDLGVIAVLISLIIGLIVSTGEFRHGTITPTLLSTPSRTTVVLSKAVAGLLLGTVLVAIAEGLAIGEAAGLMSLRGVGVALNGGDVLRHLGRILVAAAIWGALASSLGLAFRNQIGTFVGCFAWLLVVENAVHAILDIHAIKSGAWRFLPMSATASIINSSASDNVKNHMLGRGGGIAMLCVWMALATAVALVLLSRRDVS